MAKITILGAGGWGMALATVAIKRAHTVNIWSPFEEEVELLRNKRCNEKLLSGVYLDKNINITTDISCVEGSDITVIAVPSTAIKQTAERLAPYKNAGIIVNVSKGFEKNSLLRLSQVIEREIPGRNIVVLSGPSHAEEVAANIPTTIVAASQKSVCAQIVQDIMAGENLRIYTNNDVIGVELGGAIKNVIAVCVGICDGLGLGDNTRAAIITRGLAEMVRLGVCMGAKEHTFSGLSGIGDLIVTCTSLHSRNNRFGRLIGKGVDIEEALKSVGTVEGYYACEIAFMLAKKYNIEIPIIEQCYKILYEKSDIKAAVHNLMNRPSRTE